MCMRVFVRIHDTRSHIVGLDRCIRMPHHRSFHSPCSKLTIWRQIGRLHFVNLIQSIEPPMTRLWRQVYALGHSSYRSAMQLVRSMTVRAGVRTPIGTNKSVNLRRLLWCCQYNVTGGCYLNFNMKLWCVSTLKSSHNRKQTHTTHTHKHYIA